MKVNWLAAKHDYIHDVKLSYKDIAEKYGVALSIVAERASKEEWTNKRRQYLIKVDQKLIEKTSEQEADHQARLLRQAQFVAGEGLKGIVRHKPRSAREAKELWEAGTTLQAKVLGFDRKDTVINNNTQNNFIGWDQFIQMMEERRNK